MIEWSYFPISIKDISLKTKEHFFIIDIPQVHFFLTNSTIILTYSSMDGLVVNSIKGVRLFRGCVTFNMVFSSDDHRSMLLLVFAMLLSHLLHI